MYLDEYDDESEDLRREAFNERRAALRLSQNPDCRDPDHPGCDRCMDNDEDEEE